MTEISKLTVGVKVVKCSECNRVEVVRCRDCKHMIIEPLGRYCSVWRAHNGMGDEGFCNYGERKDDA